MARGQVSWANLEISLSQIHGTDSGTGLDTGVRTTGFLSKAGSDSGSGVDTSVLVVSGSATPKSSTDFGFGFQRYAAAGLTFLFRDGEPPTVIATSAATKAGSDSGSGTDTSTKIIQDNTKHGTDTAVGSDTSNFFRFNAKKVDTGVGVDGAHLGGKLGTLPEVRLEVAFSTSPTAESQTFTLVSSDSSGKQMEFATKRGRQDELKEMETGTMTTVLLNQARQFDPAYTLSPYYPNVLPVKQARLTAIKDGVTYHLFRGDIEEWPQKWTERLNQAVIQATDGFDPLSQVQVEISRPEEYSGARVSAILDAAQWPVAQRSIQTGQTLLHQGKYTGSALELIRRVMKDEDGYFFIDGQGRAVFIERHARFKPPYTTPAVVLSNRPTGIQLPMADADAQVDKDFIRNIVTLKTEAVLDLVTEAVLVEEQEFLAEDATSKTKFRPRTLAFEDSMIADLNEAATKVYYHLDRLRNPIVRVRQVVLEPQLDNALWAHALGREIGDRISLVIYPPQTGTEQAVLFQGILEYVEHRYTVGQWKTLWRLSPADINNYWILGSSTYSVLDTSTRLGY